MSVAKLQNELEALRQKQQELCTEYEGLTARYAEIQRQRNAIFTRVKEIKKEVKNHFDKCDTAHLYFYAGSGHCLDMIHFADPFSIEKLKTVVIEILGMKQVN